MKQILLTCKLLLLCIPAFSQAQSISGKVLDAQTQTPIPYVSIVNKNKQFGTTSNAAGFYTLEIPNNSEADSIQFSCLNYQNHIITVKDLLLQKGQIILQPRTYKLPEVLIRGNPTRTARLGVYKKHAKTSMLLVPGHQLAVLIKPDSFSPNLIKRVGFFIKSRGIPATPFRIRIYDAKANAMPGDDLLTENLIVAAKEPGWFWYDITKYHIAVPEYGLFVAFEQIVTDEKYYWIDNIKEKGKPPAKRYGLTLGLTKNLDINLTRFKHTSWQSIFLPKYNAMIAAEVDFYE